MVDAARIACTFSNDGNVRPRRPFANSPVFGIIPFMGRHFHTALILSCFTPSAKIRLMDGDFHDRTELQHPLF